MAEKKIGCFGILGIMIAGIVLLGIFWKEDKKPAPIETTKTEELKPNVYAPHINEKPDPSNSLSPSEHLKIAKEEISKYDFNTGKMGSLHEARKHLAAIPKNTPEHKEVEKLKPKIKQLEKDIERHAKIITEEIMIDQRKKYAKDLEYALLDKARVDTNITAIGKNNTTLRFKCILVSRVFVNEMIKDGKLIKTWTDAGFKKVIFTDGYRTTWTLDLEKTAFRD